MAKKKISKEIIQYIEDALDSGLSEEQVKKALKDAGHHEDKVDHHFKHYKRKKKIKLIYPGLVVLLGLILLFVVMPTGNEEFVNRTTTTTLNETTQNLQETTTTTSTTTTTLPGNMTQDQIDTIGEAITNMNTTLCNELPEDATSKNDCMYFTTNCQNMSKVGCKEIKRYYTE